ncbi:MAG: 3-dehydroquinate synthase [Actinomycetota bacterium]
MRTIPVDLGPRAYRVHVGPGLLERAAELVPASREMERVALISDGNVDPLWGDLAAKAFPSSVEVQRLVVAAGERSKSLDTAGVLLEEMALRRIRRDDLVVALGGGMVGDLAGFVASVYQRGVALVQAPTSLLAQVDAAVGGKTGVNLPEGKNLVGTFYQPRAVVADTEVLATLPEREFRSGLAEVAKYGLSLDPPLLDLIEENPEAIRERDPGLLEKVVGRCVEIKAGVVAADEHDLADRRVMLNYGHTFGHALEALGDYERWLHGEAVAVGLVFAGALACEMGLLDSASLRRHVQILEALGLPTTAPFEPDELVPLWSMDKKYRAGQRWVLLKSIGEAVLISDVGEGPVQKALERVRA